MGGDLVQHAADCLQLLETPERHQISCEKYLAPEFLRQQTTAQENCQQIAIFGDQFSLLRCDLARLDNKPRPIRVRQETPDRPTLGFIVFNAQAVLGGWVQLHDVARGVSDDDKVRSAMDDFIENVEVKKVIKDKFHI
jgi:hypothetical protein